MTSLVSKMRSIVTRLAVRGDEAVSFQQEHVGIFFTGEASRLWQRCRETAVRCSSRVVIFRCSA